MATASGEGRWRRRLLVTGLLGVVLGAAGSMGTAWWLTQAWPRPAGEPPSDLACEAVTVGWAGGELRAWIVAGQGRGVVLLLHGWRGSRHGMLGRAKVLVEEGYTVLVPDLPAHGESDGDRVTFGRDEGAAVDALLAYLVERHPGQPLGVIAQSLGAVSFLTSEHQVAVEAVVLESAFATLDLALEHRMQRHLGALGSALTPVLRWEVAWLRDLAAEDSRPVDHIGRIHGALLLAHGAQDGSTRLSQAEALFAAARHPKELWVVEGADHEDLRRFDAITYDRKVLAFLRRHLRGEP